MLAMCVRKAADPSGGTPTVQASTLTSSTGSTSAAKAPTRRHKPVKPVRSRGGATNSSSKQQLESSDKRNSIAKATVDVDCTVKVRDSPDGHLIYHKGDLVDKRCEF